MRCVINNRISLDQICAELIKFPTLMDSDTCPVFVVDVTRGRGRWKGGRVFCGECYEGGSAGNFYYFGTYHHFTKSDTYHIGFEKCESLGGMYKT